MYLTEYLKDKDNSFILTKDSFILFIFWFFIQTLLIYTFISWFLCLKTLLLSYNYVTFLNMLFYFQISFLEPLIFVLIFIFHTEGYYKIIEQVLNLPYYFINVFNYQIDAINRFSTDDRQSFLLVRIL